LILVASNEFYGWKFKSDCQMNQWSSIGSSDALGFGNSKDWTSVASAPDDLTPTSAVHPTPSFKSYKDALRSLLQHQMNRRFKYSTTVHPTPVNELYNDTPSGWPSAPDRPTMLG
jgi:hypothetical protein